MKPAPACGSFHYRIAKNSAAEFTHLSYQWNGPANKDHRLAEGADPSQALPEMHCWIWLRHTQEIVDFSTGELHHACRALGLPWDRIDSHDYIWDHPATAARNMEAIYIPNRDATNFATQLLLKGCR